MRHETIEDLVLLNQALLVEAEEVRARSRVVRFASLLVKVRILLSSTYRPPWAFSAEACGESYVRYQQICDAAWVRGFSYWRQASRAFNAN